MLKYLSVLLLLLLLVSSCKKSVSPESYIQWVDNESNGLVSKSGDDTYEVSVQYRPAEYMALMETKGQVDGQGFDAVVSNYSPSRYFAVKIKKRKGDGDPLQSHENNSTEYYNRLKYFSEDIKNDLYVIMGADTVPCSLHHLERTYKLTPYTNMLLAFDIGEKVMEENKELVFVYDDKALGLGKQTFDISLAAIKDAPKIKFD